MREPWPPSNRVCAFQETESVKQQRQEIGLATLARSFMLTLASLTATGDTEDRVCVCVCVCGKLDSFILHLLECLLMSEVI